MTCWPIGEMYYNGYKNILQDGNDFKITVMRFVIDLLIYKEEDECVKYHSLIPM